MTTEEWKPISCCPGYEASRSGKIRRASAVRYGRRHAIHGLKQHFDKTGNPMVNIKSSGRNGSTPVRCMVYDAFNGGVPAKHDVRCLNGVKTDCRASNLEAYLPVRMHDMTGEKYGYWTVVKFIGRDGRRNRLWLCRCECGTEKQVGGQHLRYGASKSCGCKSAEFAKDKISGEKHYSWMGGINNIGSLAWCSSRLNSLRDGVKRDGGALIISTPQDVQRLWIQAGGKCQVCGNEPESLKKTHLDHDHSTGRVRGFLCHRCNVALGMAEDSPQRLRKLAEYLEASRIADGKVRAS